MSLKHLVESVNNERVGLEESVSKLFSELKSRSYFQVEDLVLSESETETVDVLMLGLYEQALKNSLLAMDIRDLKALTEDEDTMLNVLESEVDDAQDRVNFLQTSHKGGIGRVQEIEKKMEELKRQANELKAQYVALKKEKESAVVDNKGTHGDLNRARAGFRSMTKPNQDGIRAVPTSEWKPQSPEQKKSGMMDRLKGLFN